jgi:thiamine biosynthesis protein ThiS
MQILVNGEVREFAAPLTLADLLRTLQIPDRGVAVEVNQQVAPRQSHSQFILQAGDQVEIVTLVGGG